MCMCSMCVSSVREQYVDAQCVRVHRVCAQHTVHVHYSHASHCMRYTARIANH
jgi:hypothetical protein